MERPRFQGLSGHGALVIAYSALHYWMLRLASSVIRDYHSEPQEVPYGHYHID